VKTTAISRGRNAAGAVQYGSSEAWFFKGNRKFEVWAIREVLLALSEQLQFRIPGLLLAVSIGINAVPILEVGFERCRRRELASLRIVNSEL